MTDPELEIDFEDGLTLYEAFEFYLIELISEISMFSFYPSMVSFVQTSFSILFEFFSSLIFSVFLLMFVQFIITFSSS